MTYDLALYPASGPGLGHLMRCMALAEWAVELKAKVIVCLSLEAADVDLPWPCPVSLGSRAEAAVTVGDGAFCPVQWSIIDGPPGPTREAPVGFIYPHFGAAPVAGFPTFVGPQWMPLRKVFALRMTREEYEALASDHGTKWKEAFHYRDATPGDETDISGLDVPTVLRRARYLRCPPSTIAYEAMATSTPVLLHDHHNLAALANAMWAARVAGTPESLGGVSLLSELANNGRSAIDGLGAKRLLEALL